MKLHIKCDMNIACKTILHEQMEKLAISYDLIGLGEVQLKKAISDKQAQELGLALNRYGIQIIDNQKSALVHKIKDLIVDLVYFDTEGLNQSIPTYLSEKLNQSYGHLANVFMEVTYSTIESFIILQKIERTKQLLIEGEMNLTEISYLLQYSSVAHLSNQFKKTTGLTPSAFQRIIKKRRL